MGDVVRAGVWHTPGSLGGCRVHRGVKGYAEI